MIGKIWCDNDKKATAAAIRFGRKHGAEFPDPINAPAQACAIFINHKAMSYTNDPDEYTNAPELDVTAQVAHDAAKDDSGKPRLTLVPMQIVFDIAEIREYGVKKYTDPDNWKKVSAERYREAAFRHFLRYLDDPDGVDQESGLPHLSHLACNIAFLCALRGSKNGAD